MDFTTINNRLHTIPPAQQQTSNVKNACYSGPMDFWRDLSLVFTENMRVNYPGTQRRVYLDTLREMTYHLYKAWIESLHKIKEHSNSIQKKKQEMEEKKKMDETERLANRQPAEQLIDIFKQIYENLSKQETKYNPNFHLIQNNLHKQLLTILEKIKSIPLKSNQPINVEMNGHAQKQDIELQKYQVNQQIIIFTTQYMTQEQQITSYQQKKIMIEQIQDKIRKEMASVGISLNSASQQKNEPQTIDLDDDKNESDAQEKLYPGEDQFAQMHQQIDYKWILDEHETIEMLLKDDYFDYEDIKKMYETHSKELNPLYLVKWRNLSYCDLTWEPQSTISHYEKLLKDFERFNRSLDNGSRQKMMGFSYAHKQLQKIFGKKLQSGKKIDARCHEEFQTREMLNKLLKFESKVSQGYFQYDFKKNLVPQFRYGQKMKDYQVAGLNWMLRAWQDNRNVILGDEMGLGKTIQSISLLDHLAKICKIRGPFLVIAPLSTLEHWKKVSEDWTYLNTVIYHDQKGADGRSQIIQNDWYYTDVTNKGTITQKSKLIKFNIMITSYEVFNQDMKDVLVDVPFQFIIVDEAHRLKNNNTKTLRCLKEHPCKKIMLLTGTPIQNNTKELYTLLNYIESEKFHDIDEFMYKYGDLKTKEQVDSLYQQLRPHFLRRIKDEVEDSIPPLTETVVTVGLTSDQAKCYKGIYGNHLSMLAELGTASVKAAAFCQIDFQLRKCCNHLFLIKGMQEEIEAKCKTDEEVMEKILQGSGKMLLLDKFIEKFKQSGHKMLVFSQFKMMVDIIKEYLTFKKIRYELLTGNIKSQDRAIAIQRFNEDNDFGVFLLTTKAGGLGINLTKARVVVIYDSDWNPQNDLQAIARAHRIGQKYEVEVYRFITEKTYEEQMFNRASKKLGLERAIFQKGAFNSADLAPDDDNQIERMNPEEIENLLKHGAFAFLEDNDDANQQQLINTKIEDILANKGKEKKKKGYNIQKTTFNVDEKKNTPGKSSTTKNDKKPDINDPNFWQKVGLPFKGFSAKQLLRQYRLRKNSIIDGGKESQSKFMKEVSHCVKGILDAKLVDDSRQIDEELFELLKKLAKAKDLDEKYKQKANIMLDKVLHFDEYQQQLLFNQSNENGNINVLLQQGRRQRAAKEKVDYTNNGLKRDNHDGVSRRREQKNQIKSQPKSQNTNSQTQNIDSRNSVEDTSQNNLANKDNKNSQADHDQELLDEIDRDLKLEKQLKREKKQKQRERREQLQREREEQINEKNFQKFGNNRLGSGDRKSKEFEDAAKDLDDMSLEDGIDEKEESGEVNLQKFSKKNRNYNEDKDPRNRGDDRGRGSRKQIEGQELMNGGDNGSGSVDNIYDESTSNTHSRNNKKRHHRDSSGGHKKDKKSKKRKKDHHSNEGLRIH